LDTFWARQFWRALFVSPTAAGISMPGIVRLRRFVGRRF
jgi:hypothetical protein